MFVSLYNHNLLYVFKRLEWVHQDNNIDFDSFDKLIIVF